MANINDGLLGSFESVQEIEIYTEGLQHRKHKGVLTPKLVRCGAMNYGRYMRADTVEPFSKEKYRNFLSNSISNVGSGGKEAYRRGGVRGEPVCIGS